MLLRETLRKYPGLYFWAIEIAVAVAGDYWLIKNKKPTMSRTMGHFLRRPYGPLVAGLVRGLDWHLTESEPFQWDDQGAPL